MGHIRKRGRGNRREMKRSNVVDDFRKTENVKNNGTSLKQERLETLAYRILPSTEHHTMMMIITQW